MTDAIDRQNVEFDAVAELSKAWIRLSRVAVVEDDYPEQRSHYEAALHAFIRAIRVNGRIP